MLSPAPPTSRAYLVFERFPHPQDGSVVSFARLVTFGGKTDRSKLGQDIQLFPTTDVRTCPVLHLQAYVSLTSTLTSTKFNITENNALFFRHPSVSFSSDFDFYSILSSAAGDTAILVSNLAPLRTFVERALDRAVAVSRRPAAEVAALTHRDHSNIIVGMLRASGISDPSITARSFRPTAASIAHAGGISLDEITRLGRWSRQSMDMILRTYTRLGPGRHISDLLLRPANADLFAPAHNTLRVASPTSPSSSSGHDTDTHTELLPSVVSGSRPWHPFE